MNKGNPSDKKKGGEHLQIKYQIQGNLDRGRTGFLQKLIHKGNTAGYRMRHAQLLLALDEIPANESWTDAKIIALTCSAPPLGRCQWTLKLLSNKVVEMGILDSICDHGIGNLLKKTI